MRSTKEEILSLAVSAFGEVLQSYASRMPPPHALWEVVRAPAARASACAFYKAATDLVSKFDLFRGQAGHSKCARAHTYTSKRERERHPRNCSNAVCG